MSINDDLDEVVQEFLVESYENLDQLENDLVDLETEPTNADLLGSIFRTLHSIKGTAGFLALEKLERLAHVGENLLSSMREGTMLLNPEITSALLKMVDGLRTMLSDIEASGTDGEDDFGELVDWLTKLNNADTAPAAANEAVETTSDKAVEVASLDELQSDDSNTPEQTSAPAIESAIEASTPAEQVAEPRIVAKKPVSEPSAPRAGSNNLRVDVALLDRLMNLVGELVLARNQIMQASQTDEGSEALAASQRLNLITTELQEGVMKTRMQTIGNVWNKFPRVVRDLAMECGKKVRIEMEGEDTELDKTIIEAIKDPLTHMVRNSVDHGIEEPADRLAAGKDAEGVLTMRAFHEGGQVIIEIADDGKGVSRKMLTDKALERGLITNERLLNMSDREILNLMFEAGLSTAKAVTSVSGRGVGMDVVRTKLEKIGGSVEIQSEEGRGSCIRVKIPLTLAIIPALMVSSGDEKFAIPQVSLLELVRLEGDDAKASIEMIHGACVYRLRGKLLPLVYLNEQLWDQKHDDGELDFAHNIVVLQADDRQFGLVVDAINDTEEIVVKPLGKQIKSIPEFAGATIQGDGHVALILDVLGLARKASVISEGSERASHDDIDSSQDEAFGNLQTLLLVRSGDDGRLAIPLSSVDRLEEIEAESIEQSHSGEVVQYRGEILPLVRLSKAIDNVTAVNDNDLLRVVVYTDKGVSVGLIVDDIVDIIEERLKVQPHDDSIVIGSAIISGHVTDILDVQRAINRISPSLFKQVLEQDQTEAA